VKKVVISTDDESVLAAPTTWINTAVPYLPIANPSTRPWYIQKGEVVGQLLDPDSYTDKTRIHTPTSPRTRRNGKNQPKLPTR
jgi:hypothetical protein